VDSTFVFGQKLPPEILKIFFISKKYWGKN